MTLVELMVAMVVLTICTSFLVQTIVSTIGQVPQRREKSIAVEAARGVLEDMRNESFSQIFMLYNADPDDDPGGIGSAPGNMFAVPSLTPRDDDQDGFVGEIFLPADGSPLREDADDVILGLPRDLNGDAIVDDLDHTADHIILPIRVRLEWKGRAGNRKIELHTIFANLSKS